MQQKYRAREGHIVKVPLGGGIIETVSDAPDGVPLPDSSAVREHVRLGRLLEVPTTDKRPKKDNA